MKLLMDMVHDNPGEERTKTSFRNPEKLLAYGYNTQVFKHNDTTITFKKLNKDFFSTAGGHTWLEQMTEYSADEINAAHNAGLLTMCHTDLFVLPKLLVDEYRSEICDAKGRISIFKKKTKEIHSLLFDELFDKYPLDGLIIRVGETYLHDTPYHIGNGAVEYGDRDEEIKTFIELINFLRSEVCVKHNKYLIFRTWDCFPDKFHANADYYLDVTNNIEPHEKLLFSIKHTALDFWRYVKFNPCIGKGMHKQVIEVQCQREYEGKGAYPMYIANGVINGFSENKNILGIKDFANNPLFNGIYTWSRGGGWNGPYIKNEFWCDLNVYVISQYAADTARTEKEIFLEYAMNKMKLDKANAEKFYALCLKVPEAVLHGRYITPYDLSLNESFMPCGNWIRDDCIAGLQRDLNKVFDYLETNSLVDEALKEKDLTVQLWEEIKADFNQIVFSDKELKEFIGNSIEYGIRFYHIVDISFHIFAKCRRKEKVADLLKEYDKAWDEFNALLKNENAATGYFDHYIFEENGRGLGDTIAYCRQNLI